MNHWLREPLLHFFLIGALIFVLYELTARNLESQIRSTVDITSLDVEQLKEQWLQQSGEEVNEAVLESLVENLVREEVMFREAVRLGLDKNDTIVRRRLVQKMEFLSANISSLELPSEESLESYYEDNGERYHVGEKRSFTHVYFSKDRRGEKLQQDAQALLSEIATSGLQQRQADWGDNFILQYDYNGIGKEQLARVFGVEFAEALFSLELLGWQGPLQSEYGAHLVLLHEIVPGKLPPLAQIRERVQADFMQAELAKLREQRYQEIRQRYTVNVETAAP